VAGRSANSCNRNPAAEVDIVSRPDRLGGAAHDQAPRGRVEGVVILEIDVPRRWLRRSKRGLWYCPRDIPPERARGVITFAALARSPVEETAC
jgi:hypothetical protein